MDGLSKWDGQGKALLSHAWRSELVGLFGARRLSRKVVLEEWRRCVVREMRTQRLMGDILGSGLGMRSGSLREIMVHLKGSRECRTRKRWVERGAAI